MKRLFKDVSEKSWWNLNVIFLRAVKDTHLFSTVFSLIAVCSSGEWWGAVFVWERWPPHASQTGDAHAGGCQTCGVRSETGSHAPHATPFWGRYESCDVHTVFPHFLCPALFLHLFVSVLQIWRSAGWTATSLSHIPPSRWRCASRATGWRCWAAGWWSRNWSAQVRSCKQEKAAYWLHKQWPYSIRVINIKTESWAGFNFMQIHTEIL